jgi:hypothetical protein
MAHKPVPRPPVPFNQREAVELRTASVIDQTAADPRPTHKRRCHGFGGGGLWFPLDPAEAYLLPCLDPAQHAGWIAGS